MSLSGQPQPELELNQIFLEKPENVHLPPSKRLESFSEVVNEVVTILFLRCHYGVWSVD